MSESKHTPLPWVATTTPAGKGKVTDANGFSICNTTAGPYEGQRADAAFIVRACNAHYVLLEALELANELLGNAMEHGITTSEEAPDALEVIEKINAAFAKAKPQDQ